MAQKEAGRLVYEGSIGRIDSAVLSTILEKFRGEPAKPEQISVDCYRLACNLFGEKIVRPRLNVEVDFPFKGLLGYKIIQIRRMDRPEKERTIDLFERISISETTQLLRGSYVTICVEKFLVDLSIRAIPVRHNLILRIFTEEVNRGAHEPVEFAEKLAVEVDKRERLELTPSMLFANRKKPTAGNYQLPSIPRTDAVALDT